MCNSKAWIVSYKCKRFIKLAPLSNLQMLSSRLAPRDIARLSVVASGSPRALEYVATWVISQPVVQKADNFIQLISRYPTDKMNWLEYILSAG